ncbi:MAG: hypothetical protein KDE03_17720, partial [Rhodobacteraceae bacterium]|nr:hypothetical protein [Paracoccaceae bacterium]
MSEYIKAVNEKPFLKDRSDWRDPESMKQFISWGDLTPGEALDKIQMMVYESVPGTAAGMGAGAGIAGGLKMLPGVGKKLAAMLGYGSGEALIAAPMSGAQAEKEVLDMPEEDLAKHVEYQAMMIEGVPPEDARKTMAKAAGGDAAAMTAASTFFLSSPFGEALDKVMGGESASMLMGAGKGALTEGIQETLQSGAEQASINAAVQANADPGRSLAEGVPEAMVGGLGAGAAMGAGFGAVAGRSEGLRQREQLEREREIDARAERAAREAEARGGDTLDQLIAKQQVYWSEDVPQDPAGMPTNADVPPGPSDGPGSPVTYNPYQEQMQPLHSVPYETTGPGGQEMRPLTPEDAIPYQRPDMPEAGGLSLAPMDAASPPGNGIDFSNNESRILDEKAGAIERATEEYGRQNELNSLLSIAPADREPVVEPSDYTPSIPALQEEHDRQRAEIQAQVNQAAKALADQNRIKKTEIPEIDREILHAIAAAGGLDREEARAQGIDPAEFGRRVGGLSPVFRASGGKSFDEMAEYLSQLGFFGDQEYSANALLDKISTSLSGTPVYSPSSNFAVERAAREEELDQLQAALDQFEQDILEDADEPPKGRLFNEAADSERRLAYAMLEAELAGVPEPEIDRIVFNHSVPDEEAERALREAIDNEKRKRRPEGQGAPGAAARDNQGDQAAPR